MVWVMDNAFVRPCSNDQHHGFGGRTILKAVSGRLTCLPTGSNTSLEQSFLVLNQDKFPRNQIDQLIFGLVSVAMRRS